MRDRRRGLRVDGAGHEEVNQDGGLVSVASSMVRKRREYSVLQEVLVRGGGEEDAPDHVAEGEADAEEGSCGARELCVGGKARKSVRMRPMARAVGAKGWRSGMGASGGTENLTRMTRMTRRDRSKTKQRRSRTDQDGSGRTCFGFGGSESSSQHTLRWLKPSWMLGFMARLKRALNKTGSLPGYFLAFLVRPFSRVIRGESRWRKNHSRSLRDDKQKSKPRLYSVISNLL